ncbi:syntaxin-71-like isoform X2 [Pyrus x bretschneideri]|uniref:syntaxin-71-like isoform X2 n=1 Tax=Pyrus x bretschneideri TaxID=225117 RepID=UPI00202F4132|nr:syntaxin-71-like isoform X2 [Pyrus x bretschneideri]XP_048425500.1 syntaxin-71-like isoform X2 [Pyrus x bretschneideri]
MGQKLQPKKLGNGELQHLIKISNLTHQMGTLTVSFSSKTEESSQFRKEYQMRKLKQELDRQLPLIGEIETKVRFSSLTRILIFPATPVRDCVCNILSSLLSDGVLMLLQVDKVTSDIKSNNVRLKENLNKVRSSWNFIFDVILLCIVLGIAFYLYNMKLHILMRVVINIPNQESTLHINRVN